MDVLIKATRSASLSDEPDFSPRALAQILQYFFIISYLISNAALHLPPV